MREEDKEKMHMSIQSGLSIMDAYRNYMKERKYKNETDLVIDGDLLTARKSTAVPESESEHGKKGLFRR